MSQVAIELMWLKWGCDSTWLHCECTAAVGKLAAVQQTEAGSLYASTGGDSLVKSAMANEKE
ncbi:MAG: hypothetical protein KF851_10440 [Pirellulaceae bacterium]|nr:hypothetical protein [Pirellulaceae bacterium]